MLSGGLQQEKPMSLRGESAVGKLFMGLTVLESSHKSYGF